MFKKLAVLLFFATSTAIAAEATLTWTAPTQNEDGSPLTDLAGFNLYYGTSLGGPYDQTVNIPNPATTSYTVSGLAPNTTYYFVGTAYNEAGTESVYSNEATKTTAPTVPNPPTNLTVSTENQTAYTYSISKDILRMVAVGTVPSGTACDTTMSMNGFYRVNVDEVQLVGSVSPPVVFAECV